MLYTNAPIIAIMLLEWLNIVEHLKAASRISRAGELGGGGGSSVENSHMCFFFLKTGGNTTLVGH